MKHRILLSSAIQKHCTCGVGSGSSKPGDLHIPGLVVWANDGVWQVSWNPRDISIEGYRVKHDMSFVGSAGKRIGCLGSWRGVLHDPGSPAD